MVSSKKTTTATSSKKIAIPDTPGTQAAMQGIRNYLIIAIAITTLVVLVGGYFIYSLAQSNVNKALEVRAQEYQIKLSEAKLAKLDQAAPELAKLKQADGNKPSRFDFITQRTLPATDNFEAILTIFNRLEGDHLVDIDSISKPGATDVSASANPSQSSSPDNKSVSTLLSVKASGSRDAIIGYLEALESSSRIFDFSNMKITNSQGSYTIDMQYKVYSFPKPSIKSQDIKIDEYENNKGQYE